MPTQGTVRPHRGTQEQSGSEGKEMGRPGRQRWERTRIWGQLQLQSQVMTLLPPSFPEVSPNPQLLLVSVANYYQTCVSVSVCLSQTAVPNTTLLQALNTLWPRPRMPFPALSAASRLRQFRYHCPRDLFHGCLLSGICLLSGTLSSTLY